MLSSEQVGGRGESGMMRSVPIIGQVSGVAHPGVIVSAVFSKERITEGRSITEARGVVMDGVPFLYSARRLDPTFDQIPVE